MCGLKNKEVITQLKVQEIFLYWKKKMKELKTVLGTDIRNIFEQKN